MLKLSTRRMLIVVALVAFTVMMVGGSGWAAPVPSQTTVAATDKLSADTAKAERAVVEKALVTYGLTQEEAQGRVNLLTDAEVHAVAADLDAVQAGGGTTSFTTTEFLLILIVVILLV